MASETVTDSAERGNRIYENAKTAEMWFFPKNSLRFVRERVLRLINPISPPLDRSRQMSSVNAVPSR